MSGSCRYRLFYETVVRADLLSKLQYKNVHQIPKVTSISVSGATHTTLGRGLDNPVYHEGSLAVLRGNLAPGGAVIKPAACAPHLRDTIHSGLKLHHMVCALLCLHCAHRRRI